MPPTTAPDRVRMSEVSHVLRVSVQRARYLVDTGRLKGERGANGERFVKRHVLEDFARHRKLAARSTL